MNCSIEPSPRVGFNYWCPNCRRPIEQGTERACRQPAIKLCAHLGNELRREGCQTCGNGGTEIKVLICELHSECTIGTQLGSISCCLYCPDYIIPNNPAK